MLDLERTKEKIAAWQADPLCHPLTCLRNSSHKPVRPVIYWSDEDEEMYPCPRPIICLVCPECGHVQGWIPEMFRVEIT